MNEKYAKLIIPVKLYILLAVIHGLAGGVLSVIGVYTLNPIAFFIGGINLGMSLEFGLILRCVK